MKFKTVIFCLVFISINLAQSNVIKDGDAYYFADRIIVKYKNSQPSLSKISNQFANKFGITEEIETYSNIKDESTESNELKKIYTLKFSSPYNPIHITKEIKKQKNIEWAEPHYLYETTYDPNDPVYNYTGIDTLKFEHLDVIKSKQAWDINQGSENVIIAIVDTGVDWLHEDLIDNIWINPGEIPDNAIDDDNNGYIDDIRGWDLGGLDGTEDNNPREDRSDHGTHVAGLASAVTDNGIGIASIGFNSTIMPVKTSRDDLRSNLGTALIAYGYEGIKYAADNGADVINCSWGGYNFSFAAQEIIGYAISKGALVVAAAGNDNSKNIFYPAGYQGVLSVGGTSYVDQKASWSNHGTKIDVTAPGVNIWSTWQSSPLYRSTSGTSLSSPITAGLAALVSDQFQDYTPLQIGEQIRVNSDIIDEKNPNYRKKLGYGRINAYKALTNTNSKSVRITNIGLIEIGDNDGIFESGERIRIKTEFTNYLNPITNLQLKLSTENSNVEVAKNGGSIGGLNTLQTFITDETFFEISINREAEKDIEVELLLSYSDIGYSDYEWITISINPTYQIHTTENLSITFNSSGSIGFDDYPNNQKGEGLKYKDGPNLLFEGALMYGASANTIVNTARNVNGDKDNDFTYIIPVSISNEESEIDKISYSKFHDFNADPKSLGIEIEFYGYNFKGNDAADYMIIRYALKNTTNDVINNFYIGQYYDFDIDDSSYDDDIAAFDFENNFGYLFDDDGDPVNTHIGLALLSSDSVNYFAMDADGESNPTVSWDGFDDNEKWTALTSGKDFTASGPNDISVVISAGPYILLQNEKQEFDFLIASADNLMQLRETVSIAREKYNLLPTDVEFEESLSPTKFSLEQNYPNPFNPSTTIKYSIPLDEKRETEYVHLMVFDILGKEVAVLVNENQKPGNYEVKWNAENISSGIYFYQLRVNGLSDIRKMILLR